MSKHSHFGSMRLKHFHFETWSDVEALSLLWLKDVDALSLWLNDVEALSLWAQWGWSTFTLGLVTLRHFRFDSMTLKHFHSDWVMLETLSLWLNDVEALSLWLNDVEALSLWLSDVEALSLWLWRWCWSTFTFDWVMLRHFHFGLVTLKHFHFDFKRCWGTFTLKLSVTLRHSPLHGSSDVEALSTLTGVMLMCSLLDWL